MTFSSPSPWGKSAGGMGGRGMDGNVMGGGGVEVEVLETVREIEMESKREKW